MSSSTSNAELYAAVKAKKPISSHNRKALRSHWSPKIAKAICRTVYPDFQGTYEQHLWLLAHKAAEGAEATKPLDWTSMAWEAKEKGILFLMPYPRIEDTRLCSPSHYLHYIVQCERSKIDAILAGASRCSARLNAKYLAEALRRYEVYAALPTPPSSAAINLRNQRHLALKAVVKAQMMLTPDNLAEFQAIAYGWTQRNRQWRNILVAKSMSPAAQAIAAIDAQIQARRY